MEEGQKHLRDYKSNDARIFIWCAVLLVLVFTVDIVFHWTAGGIIYLFVIMLSLRSSKNRDVYFFAVMTSLLLITSWRLSPSTAKIWHVSIALIWATAIAGLRFKKGRIIKSALAAIVDSSFDAIVGKTLTNIVLSWNIAAENLFGYKRKEMIGQSASRLVPEDRIEEELRLLNEVSKDNKIQHYETLLKHKDGRLIHVSLALSPIKDPFGNIVGVSSIIRDITVRITSETKLRALNDSVVLEKKKLSEVLSIEEHLNVIFDINKLVDFVVHKITEVLEAEKCSLMLVDDTTKELCVRGHKGIDAGFIHGSKLKIGDPIAGLIAQEGKPVLVTDIESDKRFLRKKGASYQSKSFISAPIKLGGHLIGIISVADKKSRDGNVFSELDLKILCMIVRQVAVAMENAKLYRELKHLAITDPLTQIYNYRHFALTLDHEIRRMKRYARPLCLLMLDIDDFKSYNDTFGHPEGDVLLQRISHVLNASIREVDIACRYAGDEFVIILPETDVSEAMIVAEKIKTRMGSISPQRKITVSIGIAKCAPTMNRYDLIQRVDTALYEAKKKGKNMCHAAG